MPQHVENMAVGAEAAISSKSKFASTFKTSITTSETSLTKAEEAVENVVPG